MAGAKCFYKIETVDDIYSLPDVPTGIKILKEWGISSRGIKSKKEIQDLLLNSWLSRSSDSNKELTDEVTGGLKEIIINTNKNRDELVQYFESMLKLYRQLPPNHQSNLDKVFPHLEDTMYRKIKEMQSNECAILVAGESVAGKSSFINLLIGVDILPTSNLACTATFCELRYSKTKYAVCYTKDGRKRKLDLSKPEGIEEMKQQMSYITDDIDDNENEKIEIYWPFDILEDGIVIIDTPGIGTSKDMTERIQQYLTQAFGCIYIINSSSAGGVQEGRIVDFLRTVVSLSEEQFNPSTTMFVCNKWENVPVNEKDDIIKTNNYKLRQCYPDFRPDLVYYISTKKAHEAFAHGMILDDYKTVLEGINKLLPASLENKYEAYYRWISTVLKRTQFILKVSSFTKEDNINNLNEKIATIENQMLNLQQNAKGTITKLQKEVQKEIDDLYRKICNFLATEEFQHKVKTWEASDCPKTDSKWKKVSGIASDLIAERLTTSINRWERQNGIKAGIKDKIIGRFKKDFELMEDQINDIEETFLGDDTRILTDLRNTIKGRKKKKDKVKEKDNTRNMVGLGGVVAITGILGKETKGVFKSYKKDNSMLRMTEATALYIQNILKSGELKKSLSKFVQRYAKGIDKVASLIPDFLEADRQMIQALQEEAKQTTSDSSQSFLRSCISLQREIDLFYVDCMMHVDYQRSDIAWNPEDRLGKGSFGEVFLGTLHDGANDGLNVALKISIDAVTKKTVTDMLFEDRIMRDLKNDHFITYYGNSLQRMRNGKTRWIMIMEWCLCSLKDVFVDKSDYKITNPANCETMKSHGEQIRKMAHIGEQLCSGLNYLHSKKMVHRDLKLDNVLLNQQQVVKLTDVGLTVPEQDIAGSFWGSLIYMAPEVLKQSGIYDRSADIYSLGIMIWEMWYGIAADEHISEQLDIAHGQAIEQALAIDVNKGLRPSFKLRERPDDTMINVIQCCWQADPRKRPAAKDVMDFFKNI